MSKILTFPNGSLVSQLLRVASTVLPHLKTTVIIKCTGNTLVLSGWLLRINPRKPSYCLRLYQKGLMKLSVGLSGFLKSVTIPDDAEVEIVKPPCKEIEVTTEVASNEDNH